MPDSELVFFKVTKDADDEIGRVRLEDGKLIGPAHLVRLCAEYGTTDLKALAAKIRGDYMYAKLEPVS